MTEHIGWEVRVRFPVGAASAAMDFYDKLFLGRELPDEAESIWLQDHRLGRLARDHLTDGGSLCGFFAAFAARSVCVCTP